MLSADRFDHDAMMATTYDRMFALVESLAPALSSMKAGDYAYVDIPGGPRLHLDVMRRAARAEGRKAKLLFALSINVTMNGDTVADPDVALAIDFEDGCVRPVEIQRGTLYRTATRRDGTLDLATVASLASFIEPWLGELVSEGYVFNRPTVIDHDLIPGMRHAN